MTTHRIDDTHDPDLQCWVESAHEPGTDFPIQNLPFGVFSRRGGAGARVGVAIGREVLDVTTCLDEGLLDGVAAEAARHCAVGALNPLMSLGREHWRALRTQLSELLRPEGEGYEHYKRVGKEMLVPMDAVEMHLPAAIGDYTDFYASIHHATNVGSMFRPDNPLLPNYKWVPIGYHGRASSMVPSGAPVRRPWGQLKAPGGDAPSFAPSRLLDYECEVGFFVGPGNELGTPIPIDEAERHLFGICLVNDWSARDIQTWEYQPLGPFLAKNFATTVSPWVVTMEALAPYRVPAYARPDGDPAPLPYLSSPADRAAGGVDLTLEVWLRTKRMREAGEGAVRLTRGSFRDMYWTMAQMLTHHASNGCNLRPGDLMASGTVSGETRDSVGCMLELTRRGAEPMRLPGGEERKFLEDGDEVILRGCCERAGYARIGLGECGGTIEG
ncbi:MAG TPA: fumarylacetoacetase [Gemmatimonadaceae bacterium]|nr:fumarylacetoacetase [Gemmatimonadaceae bacterium]